MENEEEEAQVTEQAVPINQGEFCRPSWFTFELVDQKGAVVGYGRAFCRSSNDVVGFVERTMAGLCDVRVLPYHHAVDAEDGFQGSNLTPLEQVG